MPCHSGTPHGRQRKDMLKKIAAVGWEFSEMPTYDYECRQCGHRFEKFQSITAPHLKKCPVCAKHKLTRLIGTGAGLLFKGSGFYETDYRSASYESGAKADKDAARSESTATKPAASDTATGSASKGKE